MAKLFDDKGNEVEAYTAEELKAKNQEHLDAYLKDHPDQSDEVAKLKQDLEDAQKKIDEAGGEMPEGQKQRLRDAKDAAEKKLNDTVTELTTKIKTMEENFVGGIKNKIINAISKGNPDVKAKLELKFNTLMKSGEYKNDEAGITQAMTEAATIVMGAKPAPSFLDNISGAGERGAGTGNDANKPETDASKDQRKALGISDAEAAKYSNEINKNN